MNSEVEKVPKSLREVWEWKEARQRDVAHLAPREALHQLLLAASETTARLRAEGKLPIPAGDAPRFANEASGPLSAKGACR